MSNTKHVTEQVAALDGEGNTTAEAQLPTATSAGDPWIAWKQAMSSTPHGQAEAERRWRKLIADFPGFVPAHVGLSIFLRTMQRLEEAEGAISTALALAPSYEWALKEHAELAEKSGDLAEALRRWRKLQAAKPDFWFGYDGELRMLEASKAWRELSERLSDITVPDQLQAKLENRRSTLVAQHGLKLRPRPGEAVQTLGGRLQNRDLPNVTDFSQTTPATLAASEWDVIEATLQRGLDRLADDTALLAMWAQAAADRGNLPAAVAWWQLVRVRRPDLLEAYTAPAMLLRRLGQPLAAAAILHEARQGGFDTSGITATLATVQLLAGDHEGALQTLLLAPLAEFPVEERSALLATASDLLRGPAPEPVRRAAFVWLLGEPPAEPAGWLPAVCPFVASLPPGSCRHVDLLRWADAAVGHQHPGVQELAAVVRAGAGAAAVENVRLALEHEGRAALAAWLAGRSPPVALPPLLAASELTLLPLTEPIGELAGAALEAVRQEFAALLQRLNQFRADRRIRCYQAEIFTTGRLEIDWNFLSDRLRFQGTIFVWVPKAYAWGFAGAHYTVWLITEGVAGGCKITAVYLSSHRLLLGRGLLAGTQPVGTLASIVKRIDALDPDPDATATGDRAILLAGHPNYAHSLWNEYGALIEAENLVPAPNVELRVITEPFGPLDHIIRFHSRLTVRKCAPDEVPSWSTDVLFTLGSTLVTEEAKRRVLAATIGRNGSSTPRSDPFVLWVSLRLMYRRATNESDALFRIFQELDRRGAPFVIILDGFSLPADKAAHHHDGAGHFDDLARRTAAMGEAMIARCDQAGLERLRFHNATYCTLPESVRAASRADYYICHHGTQQHKIAWLFDIPGLIHANPEVLRHAPGPWTQQQAGMLNCPEYVPARFIVDAKSDGERQNIPYSRDYMFVELDEFADFVADRIVCHLGARRIAARGIPRR